LATALTLAFAQPAFARECGGVRMPERARVGGERLVLNGLGLREATAFNVDVYVAALYLEGKTRDAGAILRSDGPKRLVLKFVRDVDESDITEAFQEGFEENSKGAARALASKIRKLNSYMTAMKEGHSMSFTYHPGKGLEVEVRGRKRGVISGARFARSFFAIWLGSNPPNSGLKRGLLGGECD
jgi:hypothetical protein